MALVKFGGGIIQMSGSIAGNTFARNRYGNYARAKTKPVNPNSARQVKVRSIIATLTEEWLDVLTAVQRAAWKTYADNVAMKNKLGEVIHLSGFNHFIRSNAPRLDIGATQINAGPVVFALPDKDPTIVMVASEATQLFATTFDDGLAWASETGAYLTAAQGIPQNPTREFFGGPYRGMRFLTGDTGAPLASPQDLNSLIAIAESQKVWWRFRILRADGRISEPFTAFDIVAA